MTEAKKLYDAGQLDAAIEELVSEVKAEPGDTKRRTFLFELLCFAGQWDRAEKQLDVIGHQSMEAGIGVQIYRANIKAERDRARLFSDGFQPHFLREPPTYVDTLLAAINRMREGNLKEARETLDRAEEERPALLGRFNGKQFQDFRDYDDWVGPVLELIVKDKYTWLPFEQMKRMEIPAPKQLRDLIWAPASIEALDGTVGEVYIPCLYVGSSEQADDQVKLGRMTDWAEMGEEVYRAFGLRLFLVDDEDKSLFEGRSIEFDQISDQSQASPS